MMDTEIFKQMSFNLQLSGFALSPAKNKYSSTAGARNIDPTTGAIQSSVFAIVTTEED
jgi:hypothetical protein